MSDQVCERELASLLQDLSQVQDELLDVLSRKRQMMADGDQRGMSELQSTEQQLCDQLEHCHARRAELLRTAAEQGLESESLGGLASMLKSPERGGLRKEVKRVSARMRLLQHHSLANWVLAQKALLHLSQMLEIIATGGRLQPTYGKRGGLDARGSLVDQEV